MIFRDLRNKKNIMQWSFLVIFSLTVILNMLKYALGISLLINDWYLFLVIINCIFFSISIKKNKFKILLRSISLITALICSIILYLQWDNPPYYYYIYSPNEKHKLVLETYSTGLFHSGYVYLNFHESYFGIVKKKTHKTICIPGRFPMMGPEPKLEDALLVQGAIRGPKYDSFYFLFEWIDEDTLIITYKYPETLYDEYKFNERIIIKCN